MKQLLSRLGGLGRGECPRGHMCPSGGSFGLWAVSARPGPTASDRSDWIHMPFPELAHAKGRVINNPGPGPAFCSLCAFLPTVSPPRWNWLVTKPSLSDATSTVWFRAQEQILSLRRGPCCAFSRPSTSQAGRSPELTAPFGTGRAGLSTVLPARFFLQAFQACGWERDVALPPV